MIRSSNMSKIKELVAEKEQQENENIDFLYRENKSVELLKKDKNN
jgi:hypothetical protein